MPHWRWSAAIASTACWTIRRWRASIKTSGSATARCWTPTPACCRMKLWQALRQDVSDLAQLQCKNSGPDARAAARLEVFASNNSDMVQATRAVVYSRGQQLQQEIAERGQFLAGRRWCCFC